MRIKNNINFKAVEAQVKAALSTYGNTAAAKLEGEAKRNASWTDQTANARNSIQGDFSLDGSLARISLSGNTDYFIFLELAKEKRYAILSPTMESNAVEIIQGYQKVVNR